MKKSSDILNVAQAARYLGVSTWTIYNLVRAGQIPHKKLGAKILRFSKEALKTWVEDDGKRKLRAAA